MFGRLPFLLGRAIFTGYVSFREDTTWGNRTQLHSPQVLPDFLFTVLRERCRLSLRRWVSTSYKVVGLSRLHESKHCGINPDAGDQTTDQTESAFPSRVLAFLHDDLMDIKRIWPFKVAYREPKESQVKMRLPVSSSCSILNGFMHHLPYECPQNCQNCNYQQIYLQLFIYFIYISYIKVGWAEASWFQGTTPTAGMMKIKAIATKACCVVGGMLLRQLHLCVGVVILVQGDRAGTLGVGRHLKSWKGARFTAFTASFHQIRI